jgi:Inositol monophosphatase family
VHRIRMLGSAALDLAWLADGRLDASITLANEPWDGAAGVIIAREAGATVVDADGSPHTLRSAATIAASGSLIDQLIPLIQAADLPEADSQDAYVSPYAALDAILSRARHLIFEFDGPVCDLSAAMPADTADRLRALLVTETGSLPPAIVATSDPAEILAFAAGVSQGAAAWVDAELASIELAAVDAATAGGYIHEALAACRDSGRTAAIISRNSDDAVRVYLDKHGLDDQIGHFTAVLPARPPPDRPAPHRGHHPRSGRHPGRLRAHHRIRDRYRHRPQDRNSRYRLRHHTRYQTEPHRRRRHLHRPEPRRPHPQTPRPPPAELSCTELRQQRSAPTRGAALLS